MIPRLLISLAALIAAAALHCSDPASVSGNSSDTGNARVVAVVGTARHEGGGEVSGAPARLRPHTYLATTEPGGAASGCATVYTDEQGRVRIDSVAYGRYVLEISDEGGNAVMVRFEARPDSGGVVDIGEQVLRPTVTVSGTAASPPQFDEPLHALVYGLERFARIDSATGVFAFTDLPAGEHRIRIAAATDTIGPVEIGTGELAAGDSYALGSLTLTTFDNEDYSGWSGRATLRLNTTPTGADVPDKVYDFPLLIRLDSTAIDFSAPRDDGHDIRFAKSDGTPLRYEREHFDPAGKTAAFWVLLDTLHANSSAQTLRMYWGRPDAADFSCPSRVFDTANGFAGVWHLAEESFDPRRNASEDRFHGRPANYEGDEQSEGVIGFCDRLDLDDHDTLGDIDASDTALTLCAWVNMDSLTDYARIVAKPRPDSGLAVYHFAFRAPDTALVGFRVSQSDGDGEAVFGRENSLLPGRWTHLVGTYDGTYHTLYIDGVQVHRREHGGRTLMHNDEPAMLAWYTSRAWWQKFVGRVDEVRISRTGRSAAWVRLLYENQRAGQSLVTFE